MLPAVFGGKIDAAACTEADVILLAVFIHVFEVAVNSSLDIRVGGERTGELDIKRSLVLHTGLISNVLLNVCPNLAFCRSDLPNIALIGVLVDLNRSVALFGEEHICVSRILCVAVFNENALGRASLLLSSSVLRSWPRSS